MTRKSKKSILTDDKQKWQKHVELIPTMQHPKKIKSIFKQILATLNENSLVWPNEKNEKFEVFLQ